MSTREWGQGYDEGYMKGWNDAMAEQPAPVQQILSAFPLFDDEGLNEEDHHCEWALQQDRKRLHAMLAAAHGIKGDA